MLHCSDYGLSGGGWCWFHAGFDWMLGVCVLIVGLVIYGNRVSMIFGSFMMWLFFGWWRLFIFVAGFGLFLDCFLGRVRVRFIINLVEKFFCAFILNY